LADESVLQQLPFWGRPADRYEDIICRLLQASEGSEETSRK